MDFKEVKNTIYKIIRCISLIIFILGNIGLIKILFDTKDIISYIIAMLYVLGIIFTWLYIKEEFRKKDELLIYYKNRLDSKNN